MGRIIILVFFLSGQVLNGQSDSYFWVFLNTNPNREVLDSAEVMRLQTAHLENISSLYNEGKLVAAGPFEGGGGMFILSANSLQEAKSFLETDPAIRADRFLIEIYPWFQRAGKICSLPDSYDMTTYRFIHYFSEHNPKDASGNTKTFGQALRDICKSSLIAEGNFQSGGGILILNVENAEILDRLSRFFNTHQLISETKNLWIARGTFCENVNNK